MDAQVVKMIGVSALVFVVAIVFVAVAILALCSIGQKQHDGDDGKGGPP